MEDWLFISSPLLYFCIILTTVLHGYLKTVVFVTLLLVLRYRDHECNYKAGHSRQNRYNNLTSFTCKTYCIYFGEFNSHTEVAIFGYRTIYLCKSDFRAIHVSVLSFRKGVKTTTIRFQQHNQDFVALRTLDFQSSESETLEKILFNNLL